jgi:anti-anti-sigma factor
VVRLVGALDAAAAPDLRDQLRERVVGAEVGGELIIDLSGVVTIDSHGVTVLLTAADLARSRRVTVRLGGCPAALRGRLHEFGLRGSEVLT